MRQEKSDYSLVCMGSTAVTMTFEDRLGKRVISTTTALSRIWHMLSAGLLQATTVSAALVRGVLVCRARSRNDAALVGGSNTALPLRWAPASSVVLHFGLRFQFGGIVRCWRAGLSISAANAPSRLNTVATMTVPPHIPSCHEQRPPCLSKCCFEWRISCCLLWVGP